MLIYLLNMILKKNAGKIKSDNLDFCFIFIQSIVFAVLQLVSTVQGNQIFTGISEPFTVYTG